METESEKLVTNLVTALEKATFMAKHLPSTTTTQHSANIYASLQAAHRHLSIFLAHNPQPQTSADAILDDVDSPMQLADQEQQVGDEDSKMISIEKVEERMKDCFIHNNNNKRLKRSLSPASLAAGEPRQRLGVELERGVEFGDGRIGYDSHLEKLKALDLIYQFHC